MSGAVSGAMSGAVLQPQTLLIAALGGEGGGVLAEWLVQAAQRAGLAVQATSVPGVAQRTGATSYYLEWLPEPAPPGRQPVFALMPVPGRVDLVLASELLEATRMVERGFVAPERTLLITARHRVLTTAEKMAMGDGRLDDARLLDAARRGAQACLALDLQAIAQRHRTVISAVLFGALAGSGRLPWPRALCESVIRDGGLGVETSLAGFGEAFDLAAARLASATPGDAPAAADRPAPAAEGHDLAAIQALGEARLRDYQDEACAALYRQRIARLQQAAPPIAGASALIEAARRLALWMAYEDVVRVADLKTRPERLARVRAEAQAGPNDVVEIREHLKPGLEEIAAILPRALGERLRARARRPGAWAPKAVTLHTTSVRGFLLLKLLAAGRRWRPRSLRWAEEQAAIEAWLDALVAVLPRHAGFARALAELPRLRKGYGDTQLRGIAAYEHIVATRVAPVLASGGGPDDDAAQALRSAITAALADPEHQALGRLTGPLPADPRAPKPITVHPRVSRRPGTAAGPR